MKGKANIKLAFDVSNVRDGKVKRTSISKIKPPGNQNEFKEKLNLRIKLIIDQRKER